MAVKIILKSGTSYVVEGYTDDVHAQWAKALNNEIPPTAAFEWLHGGVPSPKIVIDLREIEHIRQER